MSPATPRDRWITTAFVGAGIVNIGGVLLFSSAFTSDRLGRVNPDVFGHFGLVAIMLWGLAYLAAARHWRRLPALCAVFALEKAVYVATWGIWIGSHSDRLTGMIGDDLLAGTFYAVYGPLDLAFGLVFAFAAVRAVRAGRHGGQPT